jgi:NAD(P)H dehydrogenase (quinone)
MVSPPPVHHLLVLAHPDPDSFCASVAAAWKERAEHHHQICTIRDLYRDDFDPVLKAHEQPGKRGFAPSLENIAERKRIEGLDVLTLVYPVWFGTPPAMLKGYLERVLGSGISFARGAENAKPLSRVRLAQIATSASGSPWLNEKGVPSALHTIFDNYIAEVFGACETYRLHLDGVTETMSEYKARVRLTDVANFADKVCAEANAARWERVRPHPQD